MDIPIFGAVLLAGVAAVLSISAAKAQVPTTGLVAHYTLDEGLSTTAYDSSGNENPSTLIGGPIWTRGNINGALRFDGVDDYVSVPDNDSLDVSTGFSISLWFKLDAIPASENYNLLDKWSGGSDTQRSYLLQVLRTSGKLRFYIDGDGTGDNKGYVKSDPGVVRADNWHHVVGVFDSGKLSMYVDNVLQDEKKTVSRIYPGTADLAIGGNNDGSNEGAFAGIIDDVRLYDRALSASEIGNLFSAAPTPTLTITADPAVVPAGGSTTLTWASIDTTSCTAHGGWVGTRPTSGFETITNFQENTTFGLTCTGPGGTVTSGVDVALSPATIPAFPGARGYGALSVGGRGGRIIEVTNLNAAGPGSLKEAIEAEGPRIVVFRVAGEIVLPRTTLKIRNPYITIAGQTAPGGGITLRSDSGDNTGALIRLQDGVHDVIIQHLKLRLGARLDGGGPQTDNITIDDASRVVIDHCSLEWATDGSIDISEADGSVFDITVQRSILAETLEPHATAMLISRSGDTQGGLSRVSVHHNLFAHNTHRNPRVTSTERQEPITIPPEVQVVNNVVYNWSNRVGNTKANVRVDLVGNYMKSGPRSNSNLENVYRHEHAPPDDASDIARAPSILISGNIQTPNFTDATVDNWQLLTFAYHIRGESLPLEWRRTSRLFAVVPVTVESASEAFSSVMDDVGANKRLNGDGTFTPRIDFIDQAIVDDVINGTGPSTQTEMDHQDDFGGYPLIDPGIPYADTDHDGMADVFENIYGFNPNEGSDGLQDADGDGYTNIEEFLNGTNPLDSFSPDVTAPSIPTDLGASPISNTQIDLSWNASTDNIGVVGYRIFRDGGLVATTTSTSFSDTGLTPLTTYTYVVQAFDIAGNNSNPSRLARGRTETNL